MLPIDRDERKEWQMFTFLTEYFPDAFEEVVRVAIEGNRCHNPGEPLHWARGKSTDQFNTAFRHMWDHTRTGPIDTDKCYHLAKAIWRLSAALQLQIEADRIPARGESHGQVIPVPAQTATEVGLWSPQDALISNARPKPCGKCKSPGLAGCKCWADFAGNQSQDRRESESEAGR